MGFWRNQASRLIREGKWPNATMLAEELYAMFTSDEPIEIDSPVKITAKEGTNDAALTVRQFGSADQVINLQRLNPPEPLQLPDLDLGDFSSSIGDFNYSNIYGDGSGETFPSQTAQSPSNPKRGQGRQTGGGGGVPGQVISGSGNTYQVRIWPNGLDSDSETVSVRQLQIASDATIPADTYVIVASAGGSYYMQVPVWL